MGTSSTCAPSAAAARGARSNQMSSQMFRPKRTPLTVKPKASPWAEK
ncbi:Uncharacterised protein [Bordetella pertussis]|nr:Uncharacterised protein [Bordetella pertussis]CFP61740.1 Uncharacterised protein [Bordetella pertussis]CFW40418.1 Uncharacterised protein [Bordetella pertussis]